ncbi:MAG: transcriptional regulator, partial [Mycobacterium sp.]
MKIRSSVKGAEAVAAAATHDGHTRSAVVRLLLESGSITA